MPVNNSYKIHTKRKNLFLRVSKGHFATSHSHTNYYIDVTTQKTRLSEAQAVAEELLYYYKTNTIVDTILCLDGTEVIGTCLAEALTRGEYCSMNAHQTIYVLSPELSGNQIIFRDNNTPMVAGKHVLILAASVTTGATAAAAVEAVQYYGGIVVGISSIFATLNKCAGIPVTSAFDPKDLPDYVACSSHDCEMCRRGEKIEALVNSYGYSKL